MVNVGEKLRDARHRQGLSLRELAARADVSASLLSQIENGKINPTVMSIYNIAAALGLPVNYFFSADEPGAAEPIEVAATPVAIAEEPLPYAAAATFPREQVPAPGVVRLRPGGAVPMLRSADRARIELMGGVVWARLTPSSEEAAEFLEVTYPPGSSSGPAMSQHLGREFQLVIEGELTLELAFERYVLGPGDSIIFDSTIPHRLSNQGQSTMRAFSVVLNWPHDDALRSVSSTKPV